jgi:hypothetical protein
VNIPATAIRAKVREQFEKNKFVDDLEAVDILLLKGYQEYQETVNAWKMESHLMRMFNAEEVRQIRLRLTDHELDVCQRSPTPSVSALT